MPLAESIEQDGIQQGIEPEKIVIAKRLLANGADPVYVVHITGLSSDIIAVLQVRHTTDQVVEPILMAHFIAYPSLQPCKNHLEAFAIGA